MRILFMGNNWVGWQVIKWLREQGEEIVGLVVHPDSRQKYGDEIVAAAGLPLEAIFEGSKLRKPGTFEAIRLLEADIALSIFFGYILKPDFINNFPQGVINLHPSYLPYNRGAHPNIWSIIDQTPAGVTIHYIDVGVDTGDIISQKQVVVDPTDTGATLYHKLEQTSVELFQQTWPKIRTGKVTQQQQLNVEGSFHRAKDVETIDQINLDQTYTARDLINIIRARTFEPYPGAYFMHKNRKVYLRLQLFYEKDQDEAA